MNCVTFHTSPPTSLHLWTEAYKWAAANKVVIEEPHSIIGCTSYFVTSSALGKPISATLLRQFRKADCKWRGFNEFKQLNFGIWHVVINSTTLPASTCTCPFYLKSNQCKHVIGMLIRLKLVIAPREARNIPLGPKRKRGRPSKAKRALIIQ